MLDTLIKNARVADGTGRAIYRGHVGIQGGTIRYIGRAATGGATRTIDADGPVVSPGFIDPHTHLDAQVLWDRQLTLDFGAKQLARLGDIALFDPRTIGSDPLVFVDDLPAGGRRLIARARGIVATFIHGVQVMRDGHETGALPGRLILRTEEQTPV